MSRTKKVIIVAAVAVVVVLLGAFAVYSNLSKEFKYSKHVDENVLNIEGKDIRLKDMSYYIMEVESNVNSMAITYNSSNPMELWNTYYSAGLEQSMFMRDFAKQTAMDGCVYAYIMEIEAEKNQVSLTDSEKKEQEEQAQDYYEKLESDVIKNTGVTAEILKDAFLRKGLVEKYVHLAAADIEKRGYEANDAYAQLNYDGDYYKEYIKTKYSVTSNDALWNKVTLGTISINMNSDYKYLKK